MGKCSNGFVNNVVLLSFAHLYIICFAQISYFCGCVGKLLLGIKEHFKVLFHVLKVVSLPHKICCVRSLSMLPFFVVDKIFIML